MKKIFITGISGQDGSYMSEYCLKMDDTMVFGMVRRTSQPANKNFRHLENNPCFQIVKGDLLDASSLNNLVEEIQPDYFINFAAQSFVADSWKIPEETFMATAVGVLKCLEAIRNRAPKCRFYNAGSSEQFGDVLYSPQDEIHPFRPRSPYGAAKCSAHHLVKVYRESYNLYAVQGMLFNHECLTASTPVILKNKNSGLIDILPISEIVPHREDPCKGKKYTSITPCDWLVWDGHQWSDIKTRTATWNDRLNDKKIIRVQCRGGYYEASSNHKSFLKGEIEIPTQQLKIEDELELKSYPSSTNKSIMCLEEAELLGYLTAEGYVSGHSARFTNKDKSLCERVKYLWSLLSVGCTSEYFSVSGFTQLKDILNINLLGDACLIQSLRNQLYTQDGYKKVPQRILNASLPIRQRYLEAYNMGDGTKAGGQKSEFKCFTTNSSVLAAGLWYLLDQMGMRVISCPEERGDLVYFKLNINSNSSTKGNKGKHFIKNIQEITKLSPINYEGWLFDLETDSNTFSAGVGKTWVHNSERRGGEFVTRKITKGFAKIAKAIKEGKDFEPIHLGNIDAKRDWSHASDFMDAVWKMLNQDIFNKELLNMPSEELPKYIKEYVIASGECHTVRDFINILTHHLDYDCFWNGIGIQEKLLLNSRFMQQFKIHSPCLVTIDPSFYRPADVNKLMGNPARAISELGWTPKISFDTLAKRMLEYDLYESGIISITNDSCSSPSCCQKRT